LLLISVSDSWFLVISGSPSSWLSSSSFCECWTTTQQHLGVGMLLSSDVLVTVIYKIGRNLRNVT
jgi:hypothetical protein